MRQTDWIELTGLTVSGTHGVLDFEHREPQEFSADIRYLTVTETAFASDDISATISYADVADLAAEILSGEHVDLIETLADRIAQAVLRLGAREVIVKVHKPQAPIPHSFADVSVQAHRYCEISRPGIYRYTVGLGGNLAQTPENFSQVLTELEADSRIWNLISSSLYRTVAVLSAGQELQPDYLNQVIIFESNLTPLEMLELLQSHELRHGRTRTIRWGARTLDLDLIQAQRIKITGALEDVLSQDDELTLPHPRAAQRKFVLAPLTELDSQAVLNGVPVTELLSEVADQEITRLESVEIPGSWLLPESEA